MRSLTRLHVLEAHVEPVRSRLGESVREDAPVLAEGGSGLVVVVVVVQDGGDHSLKQ